MPMCRLRGLETLQTEVALMLGQSTSATGHEMTTSYRHGPIGCNRRFIERSDTFDQGIHDVEDDTVLDPWRHHER